MHLDTNTTILLTQYHRVLGGSSPALWVRVDGDNLESALAHLNQHDSLDVILVTTAICGSESTYIRVCKRVYEGKVWWMPWYKGEPRLECLEVDELLPYLSKYDVKVRIEVSYWGGSDL
jgi:hypothetical protein